MAGQYYIKRDYIIICRASIQWKQKELHQLQLDRRVDRYAFQQAEMGKRGVCLFMWVCVL